MKITASLLQHLKSKRSITTTDRLSTRQLEYSADKYIRGAISYLAAASESKDYSRRGLSGVLPSSCIE